MSSTKTRKQGVVVPLRSGRPTKSELIEAAWQRKLRDEAFERLDDMTCDLHMVLALLQVLERGTGAIPTGTFIDGTFTGGELHALAQAARDQLKTILGHGV